MKHLVIQFHLKCYLGFLIKWVSWRLGSSFADVSRYSHLDLLFTLSVPVSFPISWNELQTEISGLIQSNSMSVKRLRTCVCLGSFYSRSPEAPFTGGSFGEKAAYGRFSGSSPTMLHHCHSFWDFR